MHAVITLVATRRCGLDVYQVRRDGMLVAQFMSLPMARTRFIQLTQHRG